MFTISPFVIYAIIAVIGLLVLFALASMGNGNTRGYTNNRTERYRRGG